MKTSMLYLSLSLRKPTIWVYDQVDTNWAVQSQKIARSLKFRMKEEEGLYYPCRENKGAGQISFAVTAKLVCAFVFAYAKIQFSYAAAHLSPVLYYQIFALEGMNLQFLIINEYFIDNIPTCPPPPLYEPRREKTGLRGFRPCPTQTCLYSHRSRLEA